MRLLKIQAAPILYFLLSLAAPNKVASLASSASRIHRFFQFRGTDGIYGCGVCVCVCVCVCVRMLCMCQCVCVCVVVCVRKMRKERERERERERDSMSLSHTESKSLKRSHFFDTNGNHVSWPLTAEVQRRIQAMDMRCYCKILHISYKDHITNEEVSAKMQQAIGPHEDFLTIIKRRKLQWYGHVFRS